jgi:beta-lactamase class A
MTTATPRATSAISRRTALRVGGVAAALATATVASPILAQQATPVATPEPAASQVTDGLSQEIIEAFTVLPGEKALKLWAPPDAGRPEWMVTQNSDQQRFIASTFKAYVLAESLRSAEDAIDPQGDVAVADQLATELARNLVLDERVFCPSSPVFNPPNLAGLVSTRTALEAMIARSDNTATDMMLRHVGADRVRGFIRSIGLETARIPTSTRIFLGYLLGAPDYRHITWDQLQKLLEADAPLVHPAINDVETMVCSPHDFVSFYERALQGKFFRHAATLARFRATLMLADAIPLVAPLATSFFMKGGSLDTKPEHALCIAGGAYIPERWVYFALTVNWDADTDDAGPVAGQFGAACGEIFAWIKERLGTC